jgi:hypothetical protein
MGQSNYKTLNVTYHYQTLYRLNEYIKIKDTENKEYYT